MTQPTISGMAGVWGLGYATAALIVCAVALFIIPESNQRDLAAIR
ncbi:hypothetical protein [Microbispora rosea]